MTAIETQVVHLAFDVDDRAASIRSVVAELLRDLARDSSDPYVQGYLLGLADGLEKPTPARRQRPGELSQ